MANEELPLTIQPQLQRVSDLIGVPELIIRKVRKLGLTEELDGAFDDEEEEEFELRLQGRLVNAVRSRLSDIKYDLSYFDIDGQFLGLTKSRFIEEDELDVGDHLPIDIRIELPEGTVLCEFNVRAKKPGIIGRLFWG